jgi:outer membrane biosynthesis protein TonB
MKRIELDLEHRYKDKFIGRHRLDGRARLTVLGSGQKAHIRLLGDDVSSIHAYIEKTKEGWQVIDAGSEKGTWQSQKPITSQLIAGETVIQIGGHEIHLRPLELDYELFPSKEAGTVAATGEETYHQVILRKNGRVLKTLLLPKNETFVFPYGDQRHSFPAPKNGEYQEKQVGDFTIQQRAVLSGPVKDTPKSPWERLLGPEARALFVTISAVVFLGGLLMFMFPSSNKAELEAPKLEENRYTKMIFDAETIKKKRAEAKEKQKTLMSRSTAGTGTPEPSKEPVTTKDVSQGKTPKVVSQIKMTGLQSLLGKIASRASANSVKIAGIGKTADQGGVGRAQASAVGSLQGVATTAGSQGTTFKVGNIGTLGKGGGGDVKGVGGLALGGIGSASVGIVEEETEIDGGLDRDVIAKVINAQIGEIRYCYERQLAASPDLYGKVVVKFSIDGSGTVSTQRVGLTTLKSAIVEGCILRRVASWQFPKPKGGTTVLVTYPFLFKSTN